MTTISSPTLIAAEHSLHIHRPADMSFGLYALDDNTHNLLHKENFERSDFSAKSFIEQLAANQEDGTPAADRDTLDPKPYIRTFESVLGELQNMQAQAKNDEKLAIERVRSAEIAHSRNIVGLNRANDDILEEFSALDLMVNDIAASTSPLTDRLERLSNQLEQINSVSYLVKCYLSFCLKNRCPELTKMWEEGSLKSRRQCANTVGQLQKLAKKVNYNEASQTEIDRFAEQIEIDLQEKFSTAHQLGDAISMRDSADLAYDFNGGDRIIQIFVNQHDFFINQDKLLSLDSLDSGNKEHWKRLADPTADYSEFESQVELFAKDISDRVYFQLDIIRKVFQSTLNVSTVFLQRTFAERIQQRLEMLIQTAENISVLAYLRVLNVCYSKVGVLIKNIKESANRLELDADGALATLLDQNYTDMFAPYIEDGRYFEAEKKNVNEIMDDLITSINSYVSTRKLGKEQGLLGRLMDTNTEDKEHDDKDSSGKGRIGQFMKAVRLERTNSGKNVSAHSGTESPSTTPTTPVLDAHEFEKSDISAENVQKILKVLADAVGRNVELSSASDAKRNAAALFRIVLDTVLRKYIEVALDGAITVSGSVQDVSFSGLKTVSQACTSTQLVGVFIKSALLPVMTGAGPPQKETIELINSTTQRIEDKCNSVLLNTVDTVVVRINQSLNKQKKKDFSGDGEAGFMSSAMNQNNSDMVSHVCREIKGILQSLHEATLNGLDGGNAEQFLIDVGISFKEALLKHIKKFTYSAAGGRLLSHDLQSYQETIDEWGITELSSSFTLLHGIANLYTAEPQVLPSLLRGSNLGQLKPLALREYLAKRADYSTIFSKMPLSDLNSRATRRVVPAQGTKHTMYSYPLAF